MRGHLALCTAFALVAATTSRAEAGDLAVIVHGDPAGAERAVARLGGRVRHRLGGRAVAVRIPAARIAALRADPEVSAVEEDRIVQHCATPNDPSYPSLYGMTKIDAPRAWNFGTGATNGSVIVAVIDTGIHWSHPDLLANMWTNTAELNGQAGADDDGNGFVDDIYGYNFFDNLGNPYYSAAEDDHGTHVAGTIGGVGNNGVGVAGVNWSVAIMALKFLGPSGGYDSDAIRAIDYAIAKGATLSNNSWGGAGFNQALFDAIGRAEAAGQLYVAAAGNSNKNNDSSSPFYPASYTNPNIISVAATDANDNRATFSNYGATSVDLGAPGVSIFSTTPNNTYSSFSGTSMASPHVAGAAALLKSQNPTWTHGQVRQRILDTVDPISALAGVTVTGGRLDLGSAADTGASPPPPDPDPEPEPPPTATTYASTNVPIIIRDQKSQYSTLNVPSAGAIQDVNVKFNINHTWDSDLVITLRAPNGSTITLVNRRGGSGDNFNNTVIDDEASLHVSQGGAPFNGSFRGEQALSAFDGLNAQGTWRLTVQDKARGDTGTLTSWSLTIEKQ